MSIDLLAAIRSNPANEKAWSEWYKKTYPKIYYTIYRLTSGNSDLSEEITQSALVRFYNFNGFERVNTTNEAEAYVIQIAKHKLIDHYRKEQRNISLEEIDPIAIEQSGQSELLDEIIAAAQNLSKDDKAIINLTLNGYTLKEIAEKFGISYSNAGVRLHRIRKHLAKKISN
ncbi:MAG: sigma-70 family RNA polymerase sigma factor [Methylococcaceae bacterium]